eukprot:2435249-Pyramimonas_sp.AAC.1
MDSLSRSLCSCARTTCDEADPSQDLIEDQAAQFAVSTDSAKLGETGLAGVAKNFLPKLGPGGLLET